MTMCKGKILYEKGEYKTIDIEKIIFEAKRVTRNSNYKILQHKEMTQAK
jgi:hypothetical protein